MFRSQVPTYCAIYRLQTVDGRCGYGMMCDMTNTEQRSSWIEGLVYRPIDGCDTVGFLAVFLKAARPTVNNPRPCPTAVLYSNVPYTVPGLVSAGRVTAKDDGELSVGAAYCRFVRGKYPSEVVRDAEKVQELRAMMREGRCHG